MTVTASFRTERADENKTSSRVGGVCVRVLTAVGSDKKEPRVTSERSKVVLQFFTAKSGKLVSQQRNCQRVRQHYRSSLCVEGLTVQTIRNEARFARDDHKEDGFQAARVDAGGD